LLHHCVRERTPFFMINVYKSADGWVEAQSWASSIEKMIRFNRHCGSLIFFLFFCFFIRL
jgi:hypothetical protein